MCLTGCSLARNDTSAFTVKQNKKIKQEKTITTIGSWERYLQVVTMVIINTKEYDESPYNTQTFILTFSLSDGASIEVSFDIHQKTLAMIDKIRRL